MAGLSILCPITACILAEKDGPWDHKNSGSKFWPCKWWDLRFFFSGIIYPFLKIGIKGAGAVSSLHSGWHQVVCILRVWTIYHLDSITQKSFLAWKILCVLPVYPSMTEVTFTVLDAVILSPHKASLAAPRCPSLPKLTATSGLSGAKYMFLRHSMNVPLSWVYWGQLLKNTAEFGRWEGLRGRVLNFLQGQLHCCPLTRGSACSSCSLSCSLTFSLFFHMTHNTRLFSLTR